MKGLDLRDLLYYVPEFRGRTFVVAIDGKLIHTGHFTNFLLDVAVLNALSIKIVLVIGARDQIRRLAAERGITISDDNGTGITDEVTLNLCLDAITRLQNEVIRQMTTVGLRVATTNGITAHRAGVVNGIDQQFTGRVEKVDRFSYDSFLKDGIIPLISPIGFDGRGQTLRLNSDAVAMEVSTALKATKLIYVAEEGFRNSEGQRIAQLSREEASQLGRNPESHPDPSMRSKLRFAARAVEEGVPRAHIIEGTLEQSILSEIFSLNGVGTMIHCNDYQHIRPAKPSDIPDILSIVQQAVEDAAILPRGYNDILEKIQDYLVLEVDENIVGVVAVHILKPDLAELACLYVKRAHKNNGYGGRLVEKAEETARQRGMTHICALSTQTYTFFEEKMGYEFAPAEFLPEPRLSQMLNSGRNSRVLVKKLS